jgi:hypothetical protein
MVRQVLLVAQENDLGLCTCAYVLDPALGVNKGSAIAQVKDNGDALSSLDVRGRNAAEALLSSRVPPHDPVHLVVERGVLDAVVYANGRNVRFCEGLVGVSHQQTRLSGPRVAQQKHLEFVVKRLVGHWFTQVVSFNVFEKRVETEDKL